MLPTNDIERLWRKHCHAIGPIALQDLAFAQAVLAEAMDKLTAGVEVPEPHDYVWNPDGTYNIGQERCLSSKAGPCHGWEIYPIFTEDQLLAYGASQRLAGREQAIEECAKVCVDISMDLTRHDLIRFAYAQSASVIRALAASPQEQI